MKRDLSSILIRPHVTEKATKTSESSVYAFQINPKATKGEVAKALKLKYKITPRKIATVTIPAKSVVVRGKPGTKSGYKKAYVYLAKGQKLDEK